jgi:hypothetical protein
MFRSEADQSSPKLLRPFSQLDLPPGAFELVVDYLTWRGRWPEAEKAALAGEVELKGRAWPPAPLRDYILDRRKNWTREDVDETLRVLWTTVYPHGPAGWIAALVQMAGLDVYFRNWEPVVPARYARNWLSVSSAIDPDLIVAYVIARKGLTGEARHLKRWHVVIRIGDPDLDLLLRHGISDLHVHLGGVRSAVLTWQRLLLGEFRLEHLPRFSPSAFKGAGLRGQAGDMRKAEQAQIEKVLAALRNGGGGADWEKYLAIGESLRGRRALAATDKTGTRFQQGLDAERAMLARLCGEALDGFNPDSGAAPKIKAQALALDLYLQAKSAFIRAHQQPPGLNPGLGVFRLYAEATKPLTSVPRRKALRWTPSPALGASLHYSDLAFFLSQSVPHLRRLELRLAPFPELGDYARFFKTWTEIEKALPEVQQGLDIRFAIHFKRSVDRRERRISSRLPEPAEHQRQQDLQAAVLYRFRHHPQATEWARRIVRIDLAGQERDAGPEVAAWQMRALRGESDAISHLRREHDCCKESHKHWLALAKQGIVRSRPGLPPLALTCHAGEDYSHPLEGIYAIDMARRQLRLGAGDTISHGLAIVADLEHFDRLRAPATMMRHGAQFDCMLWLRHEIMSGGAHEFNGVLHLIDTWLHDAFHKLYPDSHIMPPWIALQHLWELRCGPIPPQSRKPSGNLVALMRWREIWDEKVCAARQRQCALPNLKLLEELRPAIAYMQKQVLSRLSENGIAIEFNPSSNFRISGAQVIEEVPFVSILEMLGDQVLATVNSDDPGTFGTRIENEYALVFSALRERGFSRTGTMDILERLRNVGMHHVP